jgi:hypothetical protein
LTPLLSPRCLTTLVPGVASVNAFILRPCYITRPIALAHGHLVGSDRQPYDLRVVSSTDLMTSSGKNWGCSARPGRGADR